LITKDTIDKVFEFSRVEEVISDFIALKKTGANFKGLSPFTNEKTPSFVVSPSKQIWKDFSSGKGGNVIAFLMEHEQFNYPESIKYLANKYNIEIIETAESDENIKERNERESLFIINSFASSYFQEILSKKGKINKYLNDRGLSLSTIQNFSLGFSNDLQNEFYKSALKQGYSDNYLEETGLVLTSNDKKIDRFRGRIIFPIKSLAGRIVGFGGRIVDSTKKLAKYINSPESKIYNKSKTLYGIYESKQFIVKDDTCLLVEGYMDVIQLHEHGIKNVLASSGTSLTKDQITLIKRLTTNIILLFDGDEAGLSASLRSIDMILEEGLNVKICSFPEGEDPDSFVKKNKKDFMLDYINNESKDFVDFKLSINNDFHNDEDKKVGLIKDILKSITLILDPLKQEVYIKKLSAVLDIDEVSLFRSFANIKTNKSLKKSSRKIYKTEISKVQRSSKENTSSYIYHLERQIISILLKYGAEEISYEDSRLSRDEKGENITTKKQSTSKVFEKIYLDLQEDEIEFTHTPFKDIYNKLIQGFHNQSSLSIENFINDLDSNSSKVVSDILINDEKYQLHNWERKNIYVKKIGSELSQLVNETILNMRRFLIDKKIIELQEFQKEGNKNDILEEVMSYYKLKKLLSAKLNRVV
jgi:DNA primase